MAAWLCGRARPSSPLTAIFWLVLLSLGRLHILLNILVLPKIPLFYLSQASVSLLSHHDLHDNRNIYKLNYSSMAQPVFDEHPLQEYFEG